MAGPEADPVRRRFLESGDAAPVLESRSALVDSLVEDAYNRYLLPAYPRGLAALAVGGYGRRELFPHSDVDLLLLEASAPDAAGREAISRFLQAVWDAGLRLSHSVRSVRDCLELHDANIELNISLLDQRFLTGDRELFGQLAERFPKFLAAQRSALVRQLCRMTRSRHAKFHDTIYHLEPNIKEGPGGLRDLHLLGWLGKLRQDGAAAPSAWMHPTAAARDFLYSARCFLHYRSSRDNNLLSFDAQEEIASAAFSHTRDAGQWMRGYFQNVRAIWRETLRTVEAHEGESSSLLAGFRDWRSRLSNSEFTVSRERILLKYAHGIGTDPAMALRLFQFVARHGIPLHRETEKRLQEHRNELREYFASGPPLWNAFAELLGLPYASQALRSMHETGVLGLLFPEWTAIECEVIRDFNHRYTVDEHTLITIQNLEELRNTADSARKRFSALLDELPNPALLNCALLFHDVAKGDEESVESHATASRRIAQAALARLHAPAEAIETIGFLIEHHLDLSAAMSGRDLEDPATALFLAHRVGTIENLKYLTLLTYGDVGAVHPTALSPWRLEQLWRVYAVTYRELTRELETERIGARNASPEHAGVALDLRRQQGSIYELNLLTKDRLFLFASVAGALSSFGLNILKAEAFANQQGTVLDSFVFEDSQRNLELNPPELDRLKATLERVLLGKVSVKDLLKNRPKPAPPSKGGRIAPRVNFDNEASDSATLVEVVAEDRPGLLYDIASGFSDAGCSIDVVLIDTEAHKAIDVFYITADGKKLPEDRMETVRSAVLKAVTGS